MPAELPSAEVGARIEGVYRYTLTRRWDASTVPMVFVMLNPSTADAVQDDPTIRRCIGFALREGCGGIRVVNLFALRVTRPVHLFDGTMPEPNGPSNFPVVVRTLEDADRQGSTTCRAVVTRSPRRSGRASSTTATAPSVLLDPFAGSGTSLQVATTLGRDAIGIDLDARNEDLVRQRVGLFMGDVVHLPAVGAEPA